MNKQQLAGAERASWIKYARCVWSCARIFLTFPLFSATDTWQEAEPQELHYKEDCYSPPPLAVFCWASGDMGNLTEGKDLLPCWAVWGNRAAEARIPWEAITEIITSQIWTHLLPFLSKWFSLQRLHIHLNVGGGSVDFMLPPATFTATPKYPVQNIGFAVLFHYQDFLQVLLLRASRGKRSSHRL